MARRLHMDLSVQTGASKVKTRGTPQSIFMPSTMNAVRIHGRSRPEFLKYEDAPIPQLVPGDALAPVHATGTNPAGLGWDETYKIMDGSDRLLSIPGHRLSGAVQTLSTGVTDLRDADFLHELGVQEVIDYKSGGFEEHLRDQNIVERGGEVRSP